MAKYYSNWEKESVGCNNCVWSGTGVDCKQGEMYDTFVEKICPKCGETIFLLEFPALKESEKNWYNVPEIDRKIHDVVTSKGRDYNLSKLRSLTQLPDINDEKIYLNWDTRTNEWTNNHYILSHGDVLIWQQPALYEDYKVFYEIAVICKKKYGERLKDIIHSKRSLYSMYGDKLLHGTIERYRSELFGLHKD